MTRPLEKCWGCTCTIKNYRHTCCICHLLCHSFSLTRTSLSLHLPVSLFPFPGLPCLSSSSTLFFPSESPLIYISWNPPSALLQNTCRQNTKCKCVYCRPCVLYCSHVQYVHILPTLTKITPYQMWIRPCLVWKIPSGVFGCICQVCKKESMWMVERQKGVKVKI